MTSIFWDLDGVFADFDSSYYKHFGVISELEEDDVLWNNIIKHGYFFKQLPLMEDAIEGLAFIREYQHNYPMYILTACPKRDYHTAAIHKKMWVREVLDLDIPILPMLGGVNKAMFIQNQNDILIDDFEKNCESWNGYGGRSILHKNFSDTTHRLKEMLLL